MAISTQQLGWPAHRLNYWDLKLDTPNPKVPVPQFWGPGRRGWGKTIGDSPAFGKFQPSSTGGHPESLPLRAGGVGAFVAGEERGLQASPLRPPANQARCMTLQCSGHTPTVLGLPTSPHGASQPRGLCSWFTVHLWAQPVSMCDRSDAVLALCSSATSSSGQVPCC